MDILKSRRTTRRFKREALSDTQLRNYIDAARLAPCGANLQPLKYVIINGETADKIYPLCKFGGYLPEEQKPGFSERPAAFIAVAADLNIKKSGYELDAGIALAAISYAAEADGAGSCIMGAIDYEKISEIIGLSEEYKLIAVVALGYKAEHSREIEMKDSVKYYIDSKNVVNVPKRSLDEVILNCGKDLN